MEVKETQGLARPHGSMMWERCNRGPLKWRSVIGVAAVQDALDVARRRREDEIAPMDGRAGEIVPSFLPQGDGRVGSTVFLDRGFRRARLRRLFFPSRKSVLPWSIESCEMHSLDGIDLGIPLLGSLFSSFPCESDRFLISDGCHTRLRARLTPRKRLTALSRS